MMNYLSKQKIAVARVLLGIFLITSVIVPAATVSANAFSDEVFDIPHTAIGGVNAGTNITNTAATVKDMVLKILAQVLKAVAQVILKKLTEATVNWINGGFKGAPQFVSNPKSFFKNIGDTQLENLIDTIGYNASKFPYGREVSQALISSYRTKNKNVGETMKYTLTNILGTEAQKFQTNFGVGGWSGYEAYVSNPANNALGTILLGNEEAKKAITTAQQKVQKEIDIGQGFLNQRTCTKWRTAPQVSGTDAVSGLDLSGMNKVNGPTAVQGTPQSAQQAEHNFLLGGAKSDADCLEWKTLSPGSVVQSQLNLALGSKFMESQLGAALGNSLSSIINALTTSLLNKGLDALATIGKDDSNTNTILWSYEGQTLAGPSSSSTNGTDNWASSPDKIIDLNELLLVGSDFDVDENGQPVKQTMIQLAQRQVNGYKAILDLLHGTPNQPSFAQVIRELDYTMPGPKFGWENRFNRKFSKILQKWAAKEGKGTKKRQNTIDGIIQFLLDRQDSIPSAIRIKALSETLPLYTDVQAQIKDAFRYSGQEKDFTEKYIESLTVLNRLINMRVKLNEIISNYSAGPSTQEIDENDPDLQAYLAAHGNSAPVPNPLLNLTPEGQVQLNLLLKEYSLFSSDAPNAYTVQDAENSLVRIKFQYDNILKTVAQVREAVDNARPQHIYKAHMKDRFIKSLQHVNPSSLSPNVLNTVVTKGFYDPEAQQAAALQGLAIAGSVLTTIATFGLSAPVSATTGAVSYAMIANREHDVYINSFGAGDLPQECLLTTSNCDPSTNPNANAVEDDTTGLELVHIVTDKSLQEMVDILNEDPYNLDDLDQDHKDIVAGFSDETISLLYSIVVSTNELNLGDEWDPLAIEQAKLIQTIDFLEDYDSTDPNYKPPKTDGERMYFCQSEVDRLDTTKLKGTAKSFFRRAKFNCSDFYESAVVDYKLSI